MSKFILLLSLLLCLQSIAQCNDVTSQIYYDVNVMVGQPANSELIQTSQSGESFQWYKGQLPISNGSSYSGVTTAQLSILNTTFDDYGDRYWCRISYPNLCMDTVAFYLFVCGDIPQNQNVNPGQTVKIPLSGNMNPLTAFQWQTDTGTGFQNISNAGQYSGATNDTLTIYNITISNNNQHFRCYLTNNCEEYSSTVIIYVQTNSLDENYSEKVQVISGLDENHILLNVPNQLLDLNFFILDSWGRKIKTIIPAEAQTKIDVSSYKAGVYFISSENIAINNLKFIKL